MTVQQCFSQNELQDYVVGKLADDRSQLVTEHLMECPSCETTVASLDAASDTLVSFLKMPRQASQHTNEFDYQAARQRAMSIGQSDSNEMPRNGSNRIDGNGQIEESEDDVAPKPDNRSDIRDYRLLEKLGEGGMGAVFKAVHTKLDRTVALKLLPTNRMRDQQAVARFEREMKAVGKLDHASIVRATDAGEIDGTWFLAMELLDGFNLSTLSDACGPLPVAESCELVRQAAIGLQYVHEQGMVHRDIKPSNLMLTEKGQIKILDLGLALLGGLHGSVDELTTVGQLMGTLDYMAPEQGDDSHDVNIRVDIYSLGATLYRLLVGRPPYSGPDLKSPLQKLKALATQDVPPIGSHDIDIPESLAEIVHRMLARDPDHRFATPADVAEAVQPFAEDAELPALIDHTHKQIAARGTSSNGQPLSNQDISQFLPQDSSGLELRQVVVDPGRSRGYIAAAFKTVLVLLATAAIIFAGFTIYLKTGSGEIVIESSQPDVEVVVTRSGKFYKNLQVTQNKLTTSIDVGEYHVTLKTKSDSLEIENGSFTLKRGGSEVVRIKKRQTGGDAIGGNLLTHLQRKLIDGRINLNSAHETYGAEHPRVKELEKTILQYQREIARIQRDGSNAVALKAGTPDADSIRYEGKTYQEWMDELKTERSPTRLRTALTALTAIGQSDHAQEVAEAILDVIRRRRYVETFPTQVLNERTLFGFALTGFAKLRLPTRQAVQTLSVELKSGSSNSRYFACEVLRYLIGKWKTSLQPDVADSATTGLLTASSDRHPTVRLTALDVLCEINRHDRRVMEALTKALKDKAIAPHPSNHERGNQPVRLRAAELLAVADPNSKALLPALKSLGRQRPLELTRINRTMECLQRLSGKLPAARDELVALLSNFLTEESLAEDLGAAVANSMRGFALGRFTELGPAAKAAIPAIEQQFEWPDVNSNHNSATTALAAITGKPQPERSGGKSLQQWCEIFIEYKRVEDRRKALGHIQSLTSKHRRESSGRRSVFHVVSKQDARLAAETIVTAMREYDWRRYEDSPEWVLHTEANGVMIQLASTELAEVIVSELNGNSRDGKLFVLSYIFDRRWRDGTAQRTLASVLNAISSIDHSLGHALLTAIDDESADVRSRALWLLADLYPGWRNKTDKLSNKIIAMLKKRLNDETPLTARLAAFAIRYYHPEAIEPYALKMFQSDDLHEKLFAVGLMHSLDPKVAIPPLVEMIRRESPEYRQSLAMLTINPFEECGLTALIKQAHTRGTNLSGLMTSSRLGKSAPAPVSLMEAGIEALRSFRRGAKDTGAVAALKDIVKGDDPKFSALAADALARIDPPVKKPPALYDGKTFSEWKKQLVEKKPERIVEVVTALGVLGAEDEKTANEAAPLIMKTAVRHWTDDFWANDADGKVGEAASNAYQRILFSQEATKHLVSAMKSSDRKSQLFGLMVLYVVQNTKSKEFPKQFDRKSAVEGLIAVSRQESSPNSATNIRLAIETAAAMNRNDDQLKARLFELLQNDDPALVIMCMQILVEVAPDADGLVDRVIELTKKPHADLRAQAIYELGRFGRDAKKVVPVLVSLVMSKEPTMYDKVSIGTYYLQDKKLAGRSQWLKRNSTRHVAIEALGHFGAHAAPAVPVFEQLLEIGLSKGPVADLRADIRPCSVPELIALFKTLGKIGRPAKRSVNLMKLCLRQFGVSSKIDWLDEMQETIKKLEIDAGDRDN